MGYAERFKDALISNEAITDGLTDDEAKPLLQWGAQLASRVGDEVQDEVDAEEKQTNLNRLVRFIGRFALGRIGQDATWINEQLDRLDEFSRNINGVTLPPDVRQQLLETSNLSNLDVMNKLMLAYGSSQISLANAETQASTPISPSTLETPSGGSPIDPTTLKTQTMPLDKSLADYDSGQWKTKEEFRRAISRKPEADNPDAIDEPDTSQDETKPSKSSTKPSDIF